MYRFTGDIGIDTQQFLYKGCVRISIMRCTKIVEMAEADIVIFTKVVYMPFNRLFNIIKSNTLWYAVIEHEKRRIRGSPEHVCGHSDIPHKIVMMGDAQFWAVQFKPDKVRCKFCQKRRMVLDWFDIII